MDKQTVEELGLSGLVKSETSCIYGVCGTPVAVVGSIEIPIEVDDTVTQWTRVQVLDGNDQTLLLGRQFLRHFGRVIFDWEDGTITLGKAIAVIQETAVGGDPISRAQSVKVVSADEKPLPTFKNANLTIGQQAKLSELLEEFETLFSDKPGRGPGCEHAINIGCAVPARSRPNRIPPRWEEEINTQLDEMLGQGLCRPSISPWASNVVLVTKKDGRQRFAIDYRQLNSVTKKDAYGIPQAQTILDKLHGHRYFTVIDISAAYWCVPVREGDVEKTAFNTPRGLFEMTVMPFGLVNAQATFQRLMDVTLQGLRRTESYIDDCIIYSQSFEQHMEDLRAVLDRLHRASLHVKLRKCQFAQEEVEFLGHIISRDRRKPVPAAAEKLTKFPRPQGVTELQRFLGSLNFYRAYIPELAQLAAPLYDLTKKDTSWKWSKECEESFESLRRKLIDEPIALAFPNWDKKFVIEADASSRTVARCYPRETRRRVNYTRSTFSLHPLARPSEITARVS